MKKTFAILLACALMAAMLAGCTTKTDPDKNGKPNDNVPGDQMPGDNTPDDKLPDDNMPGDKTSAEKTTLEQYIGLLGNEEQGLLDLLGEGTAAKAEGSDMIASRGYEVSLFGEKLPLTAALDTGKVHDMTIDLKDAKYEDWHKKLSDAFGEPTGSTSPDKAEGSDSQSSTWTLNGGTVVLQSAYGNLNMTVYSDTLK